MGSTLHIKGHITSFRLPDDVLQHLPFTHNLLPGRFAAMTAVGVGLLVWWRDVRLWLFTGVGLAAAEQGELHEGRALSDLMDRRRLGCEQYPLRDHQLDREAPRVHWSASSR